MRACPLMDAVTETDTTEVCLCVQCHMLSRVGTKAQALPQPLRHGEGTAGRLKTRFPHHAVAALKAVLDVQVPFLVCAVPR